MQGEEEEKATSFSLSLSTMRGRMTDIIRRRKKSFSWRSWIQQCFGAIGTTVVLRNILQKGYAKKYIFSGTYQKGLERFRAVEPYQNKIAEFQRKTHTTTKIFQLTRLAYEIRTPLFKCTTTRNDWIRCLERWKRENTAAGSRQRQSRRRVFALNLERPSSTTLISSLFPSLFRKPHRGRIPLSK